MRYLIAPLGNGTYQLLREQDDVAVTPVGVLVDEALARDVSTAGWVVCSVLFVVGVVVLAWQILAEIRESRRGDRTLEALEELWRASQ